MDRLYDKTTAGGEEGEEIMAVRFLVGERTILRYFFVNLILIISVVVVALYLENFEAFFFFRI